MDNFGDFLKGSLGEKYCNVPHHYVRQFIPETVQVVVSRTAWEMAVACYLVRNTWPGRVDSVTLPYQYCDVSHVFQSASCLGTVRCGQVTRLCRLTFVTRLPLAESSCYLPQQYVDLGLLLSGAKRVSKSVGAEALFYVVSCYVVLRSVEVRFWLTLLQAVLKCSSYCVFFNKLDVQCLSGFLSRCCQ